MIGNPNNSRREGFRCAQEEARKFDRRVRESILDRTIAYRRRDRSSRAAMRERARIDRMAIRITDHP